VRFAENNEPLNPKEMRPLRKSLRRKRFNYCGSYCYFVTIVVDDRAKLFTQVVNGSNEINDAGRMVEAEWLNLQHRFEGVVFLHGHVVMSDHFHGLIEIRVPEEGATAYVSASGDRTLLNLGHVIGAFKSITSVQYIKGTKEAGWKPFKRKLWHRNYHERCIKNSIHMYFTKRYIQKNLASRQRHPSRVPVVSTDIVR
jgi:REP element-mobilizing transposase RayT